MGKGKPRWYPNKPQNRYGKKCEYYEGNDDGQGCCEALFTMKNPTVVCKGNPHNCCKVKYSEMARMNGKQYNDYWENEVELEKLQEEYRKNHE